MDNASQQAGSGFVTVAALVESGAGKPFFDTGASFEWFIRFNRLELIERDALITRAGRQASLVHRERFMRVAADILKRRAIEKTLSASAPQTDNRAAA